MSARTLLLAAAVALGFLLLPNSAAAFPEVQSRLVFSCARVGNGLRLMNEDGSADHFSGATGDYYPEFSPDGSHIATTRGASTNARIWIMDVDGQNAHELLTVPGVFTGPSWNPKGQSLIFTCKLPGPPAFEGICSSRPDGCSCNKRKRLRIRCAPNGLPTVFTS